MEIENIERVTNTALTLVEDNELECLQRLAQAVPDGGLIVEIGCLYGGTTAVLALSNPLAAITTIDNFSWHPEGHPPTSAKLLKANMKKLGVKNVSVEEGDSRVIGKSWDEPIDFLWIDGGHSFEFVYSDLINFGKHAEVIALHDFDNPFWTTIRAAIEKYIADNPQWSIAEIVGTVAVLRKNDPVGG